MDGCQLLRGDGENVTIFSYFVCISHRMTFHNNEWSSSTGTRKICSPSKHSWTLTRYKKIICCSYTVFQVLEQPFKHQLCQLSDCLPRRPVVSLLSPGNWLGSPEDGFYFCKSSRHKARAQWKTVLHSWYLEWLFVFTLYAYKVNITVNK